MKLIKIASIIGILLLSSTGCTTNNQSDDKSNVIVSDTSAETVKKDMQILEVKVDLKQQDKQGANSTYYMREEAKAGLNAGSKKTFNIDLKKGQSLRIDTETEYPITVMLKDNSTEEYVYNDTKIPQENSILINAVAKDGKYELMVDFNEIEVFNFNIFIVSE